MDCTREHSRVECRGGSQHSSTRLLQPRRERAKFKVAFYGLDVIESPPLVSLPQNLAKVRFRMSKLFRTLGAVACLVFALSFAANNAHADTFTPVFNTTGCLAGPCPLPTAPEVTFPSPTTMTVTLFGLSELVIIPTGFPPGDTYTWIATRLTIKSTPPFLIFEYGDLTNGNASRPFTCESSADRSCGEFTFVPVATATPEPTSLALMLSGVGLLFAKRKRFCGLR